MRVALLQLTSSDDPADNLPLICAQVEDASRSGARFVLTPEVTNCVSTSRTRQEAVLVTEDKDQTLATLRRLARTLDITILIGSLALKGDGDRFVNRSFLIDTGGTIAARYDKIHMFDVAVSETETYRESAAYRPGARAVLADVDGASVGLSICYDLRFAALYRTLAQAGAEIITVPSAFSPVTGPDHWECLLRARAIETGAFILAPAQTGRHAAARGRARSSHGHSLAVAPWGEVLADAGTSAGVTILDLDLSDVRRARARIPSLRHDRDFESAA